jgi:diguanylate cyclase (GGDEF)-like protein
MFENAARTCLKWLLAFAAVFGAIGVEPTEAAPASSRAGALAGRCFADGTRADTLAELAAAPGRWVCGQASHSIASQRVFVRFDVPPGAKPPRYLETRRAALRAVHVMVVAADGSTRTADFAPNDLQTSRRGGYVRVPLPVADAAPRRVIVAFDDPTHRMALEQAQLVPAHAHDGLGARRLLLMLAGLCGMLILPLMFNIAFYRILREPFVLWHSVLAASLLATVLISSGLSFYLGDLPVMALSTANTLLFGLSVGAAGMFARTFIEPGKLDPRLRRALPLAGGWAVLASTLHAFFPFALRPVQSSLYYLAYIPVLVLYMGALADALRRGSRAARYQAVGWAPLTVVCLVRLISGLLPSIPSDDAMMLFYAGCVVEVLATTLGVADRFMAIRDERDRARTEARVLEGLSERDALTGLLNRRVIEDRFVRLRAEGFTTLAAIDLDHFKAVNDLYGHSVGDKVLRVVAMALEPDDDTLAFRMGGEEFLLLLRGRNPIQSAERRRQAIATRVAAQVEGLDRMVTASMGLIEAPRNAVPNASFSTLYDRADQLLYEAKQAGRNRTMSERLKLFVPRRKDRRKAAA